MSAQTRSALASDRDMSFPRLTARGGAPNRRADRKAGSWATNAAWRQRVPLCASREGKAPHPLVIFNEQDRFSRLQRGQFPQRRRGSPALAGRLAFFGNLAPLAGNRAFDAASRAQAVLAYLACYTHHVAR